MGTEKQVLLTTLLLTLTSPGFAVAEERLRTDHYKGSMWDEERRKCWDEERRMWGGLEGFNVG